MVVDFHGAVELIVLRVDDPLGLPFASPACFELEVYARNVDLQVAILIEAEACPCGSIAVLHVDVFVNRF